MATFFTFVKGLLGVLKDNMSYILAYLLHGEVVQRKIRTALDKVRKQQEKSKQEALDKKKEADLLTKTAQDEINNLKKPILIILLLFTMGCTTTPEVITVTEYVKPELLELHYCGYKPIAREDIKSEMDCLFLLECILSLEKQVTIYNKWKADFEVLK
jgi:hypothetical protein